MVALEEAAADERISGVLLRGNVLSDGLSSGYGGLVEFREALQAFAASGKPVHAYLVDPTVRDYYVASAASTMTIDPFGTLQFGGLASTQLHFAGFLEKYGIGIQVSRVGTLQGRRGAVHATRHEPGEPGADAALPRRHLERDQAHRVAASRSSTPRELQRSADSVAVFTPDDARRTRASSIAWRTSTCCSATSAARRHRDRHRSADCRARRGHGRTEPIRQLGDRR